MINIINYIYIYKMSQYINHKSKCYCGDDMVTKDKPCGIVHNVLLGQWEREWDCCKKITAICGLPEFVCTICKDKGWYSTAGYGGRTEHLNSITGESKSVKQYI
jgi:hypothetical protein